MRKTSKLFAIVITLAMLFSVFPAAGFGATYEDVAGTDQEEAVERLNSLEILEGYPDGTFRPDNTITRAEATAVAVRLLGMGDLGKVAGDNTQFPDVNEDHWASGVVNIGVANDLIEGYPDGTFKPDEDVSYAETLTILLRVLDYDTSELSWPYGIITKANVMGLLEVTDFNSNDPAPRGHVAAFANQSLDAETYKTEDGSQVKSGETLLEKRLGFTEVEGLVTDIPRTNSSLSDNEVVILDEDDEEATFELVDEIDFEYFLATEVKTLVNEDDEITSLNIIEKDNVKIGAFAWCGDDEEYDMAGGPEKYGLENDAKVYVNEELVEEENLGNIIYAKATINDSGRITFMTGYNWEDFMVVEGVEDDYLVVSHGNELDVEDFTIVKDGKTISTEDLEEGDILFYHSEYEYAEVYNYSMTGEIGLIFDTSFEANEIELDYMVNIGYESFAQYYDEASEELKNFNYEVAYDMKETGKDIEVFADRKGDLVYVAGEIDDAVKTTLVGYLYEDIEPYASGRYDCVLPIDVVTEEGEVVEYDINFDDLDDHNIDIDSDNIVTNGGNKGDLVELKFNADGDINEVYFAGEEGFQVEGFESDYDITRSSYIEGKRTTPSTAVFLVEDFMPLSDSGDEEDIEVVAWGEIESFEKIYEECEIDGDKSKVYYDEDGYATYIVAVDTDVDSEATEETALVTSIDKVYGTDNEYRVIAFVEGEEKTFFTRDNASTGDQFESASEEVANNNWLLAEIDINDTTGKLDWIEILGEEYLEVGEVADKSTTARTIDLKEDDTYSLVDDYYVFDATIPIDVEKASLRDIQVGDGVLLTKDYEGTNFIKLVVILDEVSINQQAVDVEMEKVADDYEIDAENADGDTGSDLESEVELLVEEDVDTDVVAVSAVYDSDNYYDVTLTSQEDGSIDSTKALTVSVSADAVDATNSEVTEVEDNEDGTATIDVTVADEYGNAIKDLVEGDFVLYEAGDGTELTIIDDFTNNEDGTYEVVVNDDGNDVDVEVDGVEIEEGVGIDITDTQ